MIWAQWVVLVLTVMRFFTTAPVELRNEKNQWRAVCTLIVWFVALGLLACTGAFSHIIGWPR